MTVEDTFKQKNRLEGILFIIGCLCFISTVALVMVHLGFRREYIDHQSPKYSLEKGEVWLINICSGLLGGVLVNYKRYIISGISGLITSAAMTGLSFLYMGWRESMISYELLIPIGIGIIPGVFVYNFLSRRIK
jgi:hypothetical protein